MGKAYARTSEPWWRAYNIDVSCKRKIILYFSLYLQICILYCGFFEMFVLPNYVMQLSGGTPGPPPYRVSVSA